MAQRQEIVLIDDVTGQDITDDGGTVRFSLDGVDYEIDLGADTAARFRSIFRPFIEAGRRVSGRRQVTSHATPTVPTRADPEQLRAARSWLRGRGHEVSNRGRIPADLMEIYLSSAGRG